MSENIKLFSPLKTSRYSFIGNLKGLPPSKTLLLQEESKSNSPTNICLIPTKKASLNNLLALKNRITPSTASQEKQTGTKNINFEYNQVVSAFTLEENKNLKQTSLNSNNPAQKVNQSVNYNNNSNINTSQNPTEPQTKVQYPYPYVSKHRPLMTEKSYSFIGCGTISVPEKVFLLPKYTLNNKYSKNVREFSYQEDQNVAFKTSMEDKAKTITNFNSDSHNILFTLFDGHGGDAVSTYLQHNYDKFFRHALNVNHNNVLNSLFDSFIQADQTLQGLNVVRTGSTGCVVYITQEKGKKVLYCANVGDTRCTLFTPSKIERLTYDHRADDISEKERIYTNGGMVVRGRVMGRLMLSRSFGDFELRKFGVVPNPYIYRKELEENEEENQFLIIACDGIWDVLNEEGIQQCIINICNDKNHLQKNVTSTICDELIRSALAEGAWDNLSVLTIKL